jgi:hypothetical protein
MLFSSMGKNNEFEFVLESNRDCYRHRLEKAWIWDEVHSDSESKRLKEKVHKAEASMSTD